MQRDDDVSALTAIALKEKAAQMKLDAREKAADEKLQLKQL